MPDLKDAPAPSRRTGLTFCVPRNRYRSSFTEYITSDNCQFRLWGGIKLPYKNQPPSKSQKPVLLILFPWDENNGNGISAYCPLADLGRSQVRRYRCLGSGHLDRGF